jgi:hypothetical protein
VQNVTDVDDPLLERAARDGDDWQVLAMRETALFREDMTALRILPPYRYIGAVEAIPGYRAGSLSGCRAAAPRTTSTAIYFARAPPTRTSAAGRASTAAGFPSRR